MDKGVPVEEEEDLINRPQQDSWCVVYAEYVLGVIPVVVFHVILTVGRQLLPRPVNIIRLFRESASSKLKN